MQQGFLTVVSRRVALAVVRDAVMGGGVALAICAAPASARAAAPDDHPGAAAQISDPPAAEPAPGTPDQVTNPRAPDEASDGATPESAGPPVTPQDGNGAAPEVTEVQVRGNRADALQRASGSSIKIGEADLRRARPASAGEMLRRVPGVNVQSEDGMGLRLNIGIRGMNPARSRLVLVQEDGAPVVVSPYGEPELYFSTPIERVEGIEVLKGADILQYGPQTVGGVANFSTWSVPSKQTWYVEGEGGQRAYVRGIARYGDAIAPGAGYIVQVVHKQGDGFRNMAFQATDVFAKLAFETSARSVFTWKAAAYDELSHTTYLGLTEPLYEANPRADTVAPDDTFAIRRYETTLTHDYQIAAATRLTTRFYAQATRLQIRQQDFDRTRVPGAAYTRVEGTGQNDSGSLFFRSTSSMRQRIYEVVGLEPVVTTRFETGPVEHRLSVGGRLMLDRAHRRQYETASFTSDDGSTGVATSDNVATIGAVAAFVRDEISPIDNFVISPVFRVEHSVSHGSVTGPTTTPAPAVPTDGPPLQPPAAPGSPTNPAGTSTATGLLPGVQAVAGTPLFNVFSGIHSGYSPPPVSISILPTGKDALLRAERSVNFEGGLRYRWQRAVTAQATGFFTHFTNQNLSNNILTNPTDPSEFVSAGPTEHYGAEVAVSSRTPPSRAIPFAINGMAQFTYLHATFVGGNYNGKYLPYAPKYTASATLDAEHTSGLGGQVSWAFVDTQFADEPNLAPDITGVVGLIPRYHTVDVGLRYTHRRSGLAVHLTGKNVTDHVYISTRFQDGIFTSGFRQVTLSVSWSTPSVQGTL